MSDKLQLVADSLTSVGRPNRGHDKLKLIGHRDSDSLSSKLCQQWRQCVDDLVVNNRVAGYQTISVLYIGDIVVQWLTEKVCQYAAGLSQY